MVLEHGTKPELVLNLSPHVEEPIVVGIRVECLQKLALLNNVKVHFIKTIFTSSRLKSDQPFMAFTYVYEVSFLGITNSVPLVSPHTRKLAEHVFLNPARYYLF